MKIFRVYNRSREEFFSLKVAPFDTTAEPLKRLFEYLVNGSDPGLWLKPYKGLPAMPGAQKFDLVYLDDNCRVIEGLDKYPNPQNAVSGIRHASALLLPAGSDFASQIHIGDQLAICEAAELEGMLAVLSDIAEGDPGTETEAFTDVSTPNSGLLQMPKPASIDATTKKPSFVERVKRWLSSETSSIQRLSRHPLPDLIAYHWSGGTPRPYALGDISGTGFYLLTDERPYPGTLIKMTLQRTSASNERLQDSIAVYAKVIRWGPDGVGFEFAPLSSKDTKKTDPQQGDLADQETLNMFLKRALVHEENER
ncbi:MAG: PilZ domain-containing protein [Terracidiphilus sp.]